MALPLAPGQAYLVQALMGRRVDDIDRCIAASPGRCQDIGNG